MCSTYKETKQRRKEGSVKIINAVLCWALVVFLSPYQTLVRSQTFNWGTCYLDYGFHDSDTPKIITGLGRNGSVYTVFATYTGPEYRRVVITAYAGGCGGNYTYTSDQRGPYGGYVLTLTNNPTMYNRIEITLKLYDGLGYKVGEGYSIWSDHYMPKNPPGQQIY